MYYPGVLCQRSLGALKKFWRSMALCDQFFQIWRYIYIIFFSDFFINLLQVAEKL